MDSNITIKIVEPGSGPIDPVVPNTGLFTNGIGGPEATIIVVSAVILLAALIAAILYYRKKKQGKVDSLSTLLKTLLNSTKHKKATTLGLTALALLVSAGTFTALIKNAVQAVISDIPETSEASEITTTAKVEDGELVVELGDTPVFAYIPTTITVDEEMPAGYTLKAYSENPTLSSDGTDKTISIVTPANTTSTSELQNNTWGLATEEPTSWTQQIFYSLPQTAEEAIIIKSINDYSPTPAGDTTTVYYGVYITPDMPYGTYTGATVSYEVEPNRTDLATVTFDGNGLTFSGEEINVTKYIVDTELGTIVYSHTPNVNNEGEQDGMYAYGLNFTNVYQFEDSATNVHVKIVESGNDSACGPDNNDYFTFWTGNNPTYTALGNYETAVRAFGNTNGQYTFGSYNNVETDLSGVDAVTFAYTTNNYSQYYCQQPGYGYYAEITAQDENGNSVNLIGNKIYEGDYTVPTSDTGYRFLGWSVDKNSTSPTYYTEQDVALGLELTAGDNVTVYAVWEPAFIVSYNGNGADSTSNMDNVEQYTTNVESTSTVDLLASNFAKEGYGFVGWSTDQNAWNDLTDDDEGNNPVIYGPNQTITVDPSDTNGLKLYAVWAPAETDNSGDPISLQDWQGCSNLTATTYDSNTGILTVGKNTVTALTDNRDGNIYTVARLADGNCWMTENLRLDDETTISTTNTNNPITIDDNVAIKNNDGDMSNHLSPTTNEWCQNGSTECCDQSYLNTNNITDVAISPTVNIDFTGGSHTINLNDNIYSYGNYYNWYSATAGNGKQETTTTVSGDLCPAGWSLPIGSETTDNGSFWNLNVQMGSKQYSEEGSQLWRSFPNNFVYSGFWNGSSANYRGGDALYWSSTAYDTYYAYNLHFYSGYVSPGTNGDGKFFGYSVRCVAPVQ